MPRATKRWYTRWWAWCLWVLLTLVVIAALVSVWVWTQRYALMEDFVIDTFEEAGFEAELDIISVTSVGAQVADIRLKRDGDEILRIDDLRAKYVWPDVRTGQLTRLDMAGVTGRLELGEDWRPSEDWLKNLLSDLQPNEDDGDDDAQTELPENGIGLTDAALTLVSPLGETKFEIDADVASWESFTAKITLPLTDLSYGGISATGEGVLIIEPFGDRIKIQGQAQTESLSNSKLQIDDAFLRWDGTANLAARAYDGHISVDSLKIKSDVFEAEAARFSWDGAMSNSGEIVAKGQWLISADQARTPRPARANELADKLSLFPALSVVPAAEHYAPELKQVVESFFLGANVKGEGDLDYSAAGFKLTPVGTISVETPENSLRLTPRDGRDFFVFDAERESMLVQMDAAFDSPVGLTLTDIELNAKSENGIRLGGVESFTANLETNRDWTAVDEDGRPVRLGPLAASMRYTGGVEPRRLTINTALDYDGTLPGGRVEALNLEGRLDVRLYEGRQVLDFTPLADRRITLKSMETPTTWVGEDMSFNLLPATNLFTRTAEESVFSAVLEMADFTLIQPATSAPEAQRLAQRLEVQSAAMKLKGQLTPDRTQNWTIDLEDVVYASDTLPGPGTSASAQQANLTARLMPDMAPQITLNSPSITVETPLARLSNFEFALKGTPDNYSVDHKGGSVDVIGSEFADLAEAAGLARFPANGRVEFAEGRFSGVANLVVAKANNADVSVAYEFANGAGRANIDIPSILFEPKGLQPQTLVPAFRGKIARVEGEARAKLNIAFADGVLTDSSGTVQLVDMDVGTAPGPISGLNTTLRFASLWPLQTNGRQTLSLESFNPGLPLEDGVINYELVSDGVQVHAADWPIGNGFFSLDPFTWLYGAAENRVTMRVKDVALGDFLNDLGNRKVKATGNVVGVFPIVVRGIEVLIEDGNVSVPNGGMITYEPGPNVPSYTQEDAIAVLREQRTSEYALLAQDALREFRYKELSASLDGPLDGDVEIGLVFDGSNEKVLNRQPFRFDISVRGELFNIARSFNSNAQVKAEILRQDGKLPEGTIIGE